MTLEEEKELRTYAIYESKRTLKLSEEKATQAVDLVMEFLEKPIETKPELAIYLVSQGVIADSLKVIGNCIRVKKILDKGILFIKERTERAEKKRRLRIEETATREAREERKAKERAKIDERLKVVKARENYSQCRKYIISELVDGKLLTEKVANRATDLVLAFKQNTTNGLNLKCYLMDTQGFSENHPLQKACAIAHSVIRKKNVKRELFLCGSSPIIQGSAKRPRELNLSDPEQPLPKKYRGQTAEGEQLVKKAIRENVKLQF